MGHVGDFKFLKIFHCHLLKKCFKKAVEAFKVWTSKGITAGRKFLNCVLRAKRAQKRVKSFQNGNMSCSGHFGKIKFRVIFEGKYLLFLMSFLRKITSV